MGQETHVKKQRMSKMENDLGIEFIGANISSGKSEIKDLFEELPESI